MNKEGIKEECIRKDSNAMSDARCIDIDESWVDWVSL